MAFGRRTAATGGGGDLGRRFLGGSRSSFGVSGGQKAADGGRRRRWRMLKPHTQAASQGAVVPAGAGVPGKNGARTAFSRAQPGKNQASPGRKGAFGRPSGAALAGVGGKKAPFAAKVLAEGLCWGENWREELAGREGLSGPLQVIFGRTGRKRLGLCKALSRAYRKKNVPAHFLCR